MVRGNQGENRMVFVGIIIVLGTILGYLWHKGWLDDIGRWFS